MATLLRVDGDIAETNQLPLRSRLNLKVVAMETENKQKQIASAKYKRIEFLWSIFFNSLCLAEHHRRATSVFDAVIDSVTI